MKNIVAKTVEIQFLPSRNLPCTIIIKDVECLGTHERNKNFSQVSNKKKLHPPVACKLYKVLQMQTKFVSISTHFHSSNL